MNTGVTREPEHLDVDRSSLLARVEAIPTTVLADKVRDAGYPNQVVEPGIVQMAGPAARVAGWAFTVDGGEPTAGEAGPDYLKARAIDHMGRDQVAVWAGGDIEGVCLFGDLLAAGMHARGVKAAVVDGGVRDVEDFEETGFRVFARYVTPKASTGFWRVRSFQERVLLPGAGSAVSVGPGDLVVADGNGVVVLPVDVTADIVDAAEAHVRQEAEVRSRIIEGESLETLMRQYGRI